LPKANPAIRKQLKDDLAQFGKQVLHQRLMAIDPESAARIHHNDPQRIQRALEVYQLSGQPLSFFFKTAQQVAFPYPVFKIIIAPENRQQLHDTIAQRFHIMLEQGLIAEVKKLYQRNDLDESLPAIRTVGYRQVWAYLKGEQDRQSMTEKAIIATRQLAKRQYTWLKKETDAQSFKSNDQQLFNQVSTAINTFIINLR
jgi:tRNA dimethylallyltransferase